MAIHRLISLNWNGNTRFSKTNCTKRSCTFQRDDLQIVELKRRKLMVKDEIERLKTYRGAKRCTNQSSRTSLKHHRHPKMGAIALICLMVLVRRDA